MAAEPPRPQPGRRPTPNHPPYSEMVQCAIRELAEPQGSTESSISAYIESHYDSLPWGHSKLLPYYLSKLISHGEISTSSSSSCFPIRYVLPQTPNPNPNPSGTPKKRGRPRKIVPLFDNGVAGRNHNPIPNPKKDGRGRPRKVITPNPKPRCDFDLELEKWGKKVKFPTIDPSPKPKKDGRGRPRKAISPNPSCDFDLELGKWDQKVKFSTVDVEADRNPNPSPKPKKDGRGRPQKVIRVKPDLEFKKCDQKVKFSPVDVEGGCNADTVFSETETIASEQRPKLILKLKRRQSVEIDGDGSVVSGGWLCLRGDESQVADTNEEALVLRENDLNGAKIDERNEEMLDLLERDLDGCKVDEQNEDLLALQEKDFDCIKDDEHRTSSKKAKPKKSRRLWYEG